MRLSKIKYKNLKGDAHWNLILESMDDVRKYFDIYSKDFSDKAIKFWFKAKDEKIGYSLSSLGHYITNSAEAIAFHELSFAIECSENGEVSIVDYANKVDSIQLQKFKTMLEIASQGKMIRINFSSGYSIFDLNFYEEIESKKLSNIQYAMFIKGGKLYDKFNEDDFFKQDIINITHSTLVIENDNVLSERMHKYLESEKDVQILVNFERDTNGYEQEDYFTMFTNAINNGLNKIIVETTLIKENQFFLIKKLLEKITLDLKSPLKIVLLLNKEHEIEVQSKYISLTKIIN